ncbi:sorting nexin [Anaeramoeba flamelloides]|uniref:Sorting nexin n=1 Tax=Anaeramoeba flamelloides TaxID=1746091 RepID=A0AAV7ZMP6_9EUKA|nr:sorting nexin [Anaeramoeba flamelloides]
MSTYIATSNFEGSDKDDLSFEIGDEIIVTTKKKDGWWVGYLATDTFQTKGKFPDSSTFSDKNEFFIENGFKWKASDQKINTKVTKISEKGKIRKNKFYHIQTTINTETFQSLVKWEDLVWLRKVYSQNFPNLGIPNLIDLEIFDRNSRGGTDNRKPTIQIFLNRICAHPVLSKPNFFIDLLKDNNILTNKKKKEIKRKKYIFWKNVKTNNTPPSIDFPQQLHSFKSNLDSHSQILDKINFNFTQMSMNCYSSMFHSLKKVGKSFIKWSTKSFDWEDGIKINNNDDDETNINNFILKIGESFTKISKLYSSQSKKELNNMIPFLVEYQKISKSYEKMMELCESSQLDYFYKQTKNIKSTRKQSKKEIDKRQKEAETKKIISDIILNVTITELEYFRKMRKNDTQTVLIRFLNDHIQFHQQIMTILEDVRREFIHN